MLLIFHIVCAVGSLVVALYSFFEPSQTRLRLTYALTAFMLASGSVLLYLKPVNITQTCVSGLVYLAVIFAAVFGAKRKLQKV